MFPFHQAKKSLGKHPKTLIKKQSGKLKRQLTRLRMASSLVSLMH